MSKMDEQILVAPRSTTFNNEELAFQGVLSDTEKVKQIVQNMSASYTSIRRGDAEEDPKLKQPIPYLVIKRGHQVYAYKRLSGGGEKRLHNKISIGLGGHANAVPNKDFYDVMLDNLSRELHEEVFINDNKLTLDTIGLVNDDSEPVSEVHLGLLMIGELDESEDVTVRETEQLEGFWIDITDLKNKDIYDKLESWSKFVADILTEKK